MEEEEVGIEMVEMRDDEALEDKDEEALDPLRDLRPMLYDEGLEEARLANLNNVVRYPTPAFRSSWLCQRALALTSIRLSG